MSRVSKAARFLNQVLDAMEVYLVIKVDDVASHDISIFEFSRKLPRSAVVFAPRIIFRIKK